MTSSDIPEVPPDRWNFEPYEPPNPQTSQHLAAIDREAGRHLRYVVDAPDAVTAGLRVLAVLRQDEDEQGMAMSGIGDDGMIAPGRWCVTVRPSITGRPAESGVGTELSPYVLGGRWNTEMPLPYAETLNLILTPNGNQLAVVLAHITPSELAVFHDAPITVGLVTGPNVFLLPMLWDGPNGSCLCGDAVFEVSKQEAVDVPVAIPEAHELMISLFLVEATTGIIQGIRMISPGSDMVDALRDAVAAQRVYPGNPLETRGWVQDVQELYPDTACLLKNRADIVWRTPRRTVR